MTVILGWADIQIRTTPIHLARGNSRDFPGRQGAGWNPGIAHPKGTYPSKHPVEQWCPEGHPVEQWCPEGHPVEQWCPGGTEKVCNCAAGLEKSVKHHYTSNLQQAVLFLNKVDLLAIILYATGKLFWLERIL